MHRACCQVGSRPLLHGSPPLPSVSPPSLCLSLRGAGRLHRDVAMTVGRCHRAPCPHFPAPAATQQVSTHPTRPTALQTQTRHRLLHVIAKHALAHVVTPLPSACHRKTQPCNRTRVSVFCMSLRTSAHTGVAIRIPAGMPGKLAAVWANSWRFSDLPKVLLFVLCCRKEYGLSRRCASRNDKGGRHILAPHVLATADTLPPSACHCEPVRTLVRQSASPQRNLASW